MSIKFSYKEWFKNKYRNDIEWRKKRIKASTEYQKQHPPKSYYVKTLPPLSVRFWKKVNRKDENKCWEWLGSRYPSGYGRLSKKYAHRLSFEIINGLIPKGMHVLHTCDNPPCVNPKHLWVGTAGDNMRDRDKKGRGRFSKKSN